jgi:hypothetical protein
MQELTPSQVQRLLARMLPGAPGLEVWQCASSSSSSGSGGSGSGNSGNDSSGGSRRPGVVALHILPPTAVALLLPDASEISFFPHVYGEEMAVPNHSSSSTSGSSGSCGGSGCGGGCGRTAAACNAISIPRYSNLRTMLFHLQMALI